MNEPLEKTNLNSYLSAYHQPKGICGDPWGTFKPSIKLLISAGVY